MKRFTLIFCLLFTVFTPVVFAHSSAEEAATTEASTKDNLENNAEYTLPYPGILPDNPLYPIKALRDRLVGFLISDPVRRAEFNILQADKRLQSGVSLIDKKNYKLAIDTISKGENYLEEAFSKLNEAKKQGGDIANLADKFKKSTRKHREVITILAKKSPKDHSRDRDFSILKKRIDEINKKAEVFSL